MWYKVNKRYVGTTKIRPIEKVTYNFTTAPHTITLAKSWATINSITMELESNYTTNDWNWWSYILLKEKDADPIYQALAQITWTYQRDSNQWYFKITNWSTDIYNSNFPSSASTRTNSAMSLKVWLNWYEVKIWQSYGSWLYTNTYTYNSAEKQVIQSIFNSATACARYNSWINGNVSIKRVVVEY